MRAASESMAAKKEAGVAAACMRVKEKAFLVCFSTRIDEKMGV
jgi:hypothetical protein